MEETISGVLSYNNLSFFEVQEDGRTHYAIFKEGLLGIKHIGSYVITPDEESKNCVHTISLKNKAKEEIIKEKVIQELKEKYCMGFLQGIYCDNPERSAERCSDKEQCEIYHRIKPRSEIPLMR